MRTFKRHAFRSSIIEHYLESCGWVTKVVFKVNFDIIKKQITFKHASKCKFSYGKKNISHWLWRKVERSFLVILCLSVLVYYLDFLTIFPYVEKTRESKQDRSYNKSKYVIFLFFYFFIIKKDKYIQLTVEQLRFQLYRSTYEADFSQQ